MTFWRRMRDDFLSRFGPQPLGRRGEWAAARFLKRRGMKIVAAGWRGHFGELDLVAVQGQTVVFVEVKTRRSTAAGHPAEAVDQHKQARMTRAAMAYLKRHGLMEYPARFDVVAMVWPKSARRPQIEYIPNAFEATEQVWGNAARSRPGRLPG